MTIDEIIGELAGYTSMCWEPKPTGVFDSSKASEAVKEAKSALKKLVMESCVPEEKHVPIEMESTGRYDPEIYWNDCRTQTLTNINKLFGGVEG
jgi:hypothetical protein